MSIALILCIYVNSGQNPLEMKKIKCLRKNATHIKKLVMSN